MYAVASPRSHRDVVGRFVVARWPWLALAAITVLALAVRVLDITDNPPGFFTDEAASGLDAQAILTTGKDIHGHTLPVFFESVGDYKLPVFIYTLMPFVGVLGLSEFTVRFTVAVIGTLTVVTTYLLARELLHRDAAPSWRAELPALASAGLLAILPWHIHYSRTGFGEMVSFPLVFTLAWWLFLRGQRTGGSIVPAAIAFGVCFYTYRSGWVVLPPFLLLLILLYRDDFMARRRDSLNAAAFFVAILLPLASHLLFGPDDRAAQAWIFDSPSEKDVVPLFIEQYRSYFTLSFLIENADNGAILRHYLPGHGVLYWFMLPLVIAGVVGVLQQRDRPGLLLLGLLLLYPLGGALSNLSPISSRAILGSLVFVLLSGRGVQAMVEGVAVIRPRLTTAAACVLTTGIVVTGAVGLGAYLNRYFDVYPQVAEGYWGWQEGAEEIIERFVTLEDQYDELYLEGYFNAPAVFIPFYAGDDCRNCRIGEVNRYDATLRQIFAFRAESTELLKVDSRVVDTLPYRDGRPAFVLVEILGER